jgi:hypothetical protein
MSKSEVGERAVALPVSDEPRHSPFAHVENFRALLISERLVSLCRYDWWSSRAGAQELAAGALARA